MILKWKGDQSGVVACFGGLGHAYCLFHNTLKWRTDGFVRALKADREHKARSLFNDDNHSHFWLSDRERAMNVVLNSPTSILAWLVAPKTASIDQKTSPCKKWGAGVHPSKRPINVYPWWSRPGIPVFTECLMDWHQNRTARKPHPIMSLRPTLKGLFKTQRIFQSLNLSRSNHISD